MVELEGQNRLPCVNRGEILDCWVRASTVQNPAALSILDTDRQSVIRFCAILIGSVNCPLNSAMFQDVNLGSQLEFSSTDLFSFLWMLSYLTTNLGGSN
jgi:hypothetical protein